MSFFLPLALLLLVGLIFLKKAPPKIQTQSILKLSSLTLNILWIVFWIVALITLLPNALNIFINSDKEVALSTVLPIHFQVDLHEQDPNVTIETDSQVEISKISEADGNIVFQTKSVRLQYIALLGGVLDVMAALFIVFQLKKIVSNICKEKPFMEGNLSRIRKIAYAVLIYQFLKGFYIFVTSSIVATEFYMNIYMPEVMVQPIWEVFNLSFIGFVLTILVIEHAFREGLKLQEEKDLTI